MALSAAKKKQVRDRMVLYSAQAVDNEGRWHYTQSRPFHYYDDAANGFHSGDCSSFVGNMFWNAMHDTGIYLHDPLDFRYTGFGNTWSLESYLRRNGKAVTQRNGYWIGDVARYGQGNHSHTTICTKNGTAKTSEWTSFGQESGPEYRTLDYRPDLIGVWRHPALL